MSHRILFCICHMLLMFSVSLLSVLLLHPVGREVVLELVDALLYFVVLHLSLVKDCDWLICKCQFSSHVI